MAIDFSKYGVPSVEPPISNKPTNPLINTAEAAGVPLTPINNVDFSKYGTPSAGPIDLSQTSRSGKLIDAIAEAPKDYLTGLYNTITNVPSESMNVLKEGQATIAEGQKQGGLPGYLTKLKGEAQIGYRLPIEAAAKPYYAPVVQAFQTGAGVINKAFPEIGETINKGVNYAADKISDIPAVQSFATNFPNAEEDLNRLLYWLGAYQEGKYQTQQPSKTNLPPQNVKIWEGETIPPNYKGQPGPDVSTGLVGGLKNKFNELTFKDRAQMEQFIKQEYTTAVRPSVRGKTTVSGAEHALDQAVGAVETIGNLVNEGKIQIEDSFGEVSTKLPQTLGEFAQAIDIAKKEIWKQVEDTNKALGVAVPSISTQPVILELEKIANNKVVLTEHPEVAEYAQKAADLLKVKDPLNPDNYKALEYTPSELQAAITSLNQELKGMKTYGQIKQASVDALKVNIYNQILDAQMAELFGDSNKGLRRQYSDLATIERDVVHRAIVDARKNSAGLLDYTNVFTAADVIKGIVGLNPAALVAGGVGKAIQLYYKILNNPNVRIKKMFETTQKNYQKGLEIEKYKKMQDQAPTKAPKQPKNNGKMFGNINIGLQIKDVSGGKSGTPIPSPKPIKTVPGTYIKEARELLSKLDDSKARNALTVLNQYPGDEIAKAMIKEFSKTKYPDLIKEAKKYKTAEEFVKKIRGSSTQYGDYTPELRGYGMEDYKNVSELGVNPDEIVTIYRGIDKTTGNVKKQINDGDFVTTDLESALAYTGDIKDVVSKEVKAKTLYTDSIQDFKDKPFFIGSEYVYTTKKIEPLSKQQLTDIWNEVNKK